MANSSRVINIASNISRNIEVYKKEIQTNNNIKNKECDVCILRFYKLSYHNKTKI